MADDSGLKIADLQRWYRDHCDDDWEHQYGIKINTIDNPGWRIEVLEAADPHLAMIPEGQYQNEDDEDDWIHILRPNKGSFGATVQIYCGPLNLERAIAIIIGKATPPFSMS